MSGLHFVCAVRWGGRYLQLIKLPVPEIPRRILKDETCFQNPGRAGGRGSGRERDCRKRNKKTESGGDLQVVGLPGGRVDILGRGRSSVQLFRVWRVALTEAQTSRGFSPHSCPQLSSPPPPTPLRKQYRPRHAGSPAAIQSYPRS